MTHEREKRDSESKQAVTDKQIAQIQQLAKSIRYGSITLVFQDGVLVQIDRNEKMRLR